MNGMRRIAGKRWSRLARAAAIAAVVLILAFVSVDDWSRDFTQYEAAISPSHSDPALRPVLSQRPTPDLLSAVKAAARRIRNWEYVGEAVDGETTLILFVRVNRLFRWKDDVTVRIEDLGSRRQVTAGSRSRLRVGDLGRNPRSLRRFREELEAVLAGAAPSATAADVR